MESEGKAGIGSVVMRTKQYLAAIRPLDGALAMSTMRFADEVVPQSDIDALPGKGAKPEAKELKLASQIIGSLTTDWDPKRYHDTYTEELKDLIEAKAKGKKIMVEEAAGRPRARSSTSWRRWRRAWPRPARAAGRSCRRRWPRRPRSWPRRRTTTRTRTTRAGREVGRQEDAGQEGPPRPGQEGGGQEGAGQEVAGQEVGGQEGAASAGRQVRPEAGPIRDVPVGDGTSPRPVWAAAAAGGKSGQFGTGSCRGLGSGGSCDARDC